MSNKKISQIRKRSGEIVDFKEEKIEEAIVKAMKEVGEDDFDLAKKVVQITIDKISKKFHQNTIPAVEEVQDLVEETLIEQKLIKVAKVYILYRDQRRQLREISTDNSEEKLMESYLGRADWRLKENSNMSFSVQGLNNYIASAVSAKYWLNKLYPEKIRKSHEDGDFHIHDLGLLAPYCCGWDLKDLLLKGFGGVKTKIQSKPPKHFRSALGQVVNFFYTMQGEAAGAQAFANFDTYLAPFIRYDDLSYRDVKQAMQEFVFNLNVPTRVGFQTPFTNVTLDVIPSKTLGEENVVIGGKIMDEKYSDFQTEMDLFNKAFAEVMIEGDASGRVFSFPIPTYNVDKDFDWNRECLKPMWEMTSKYGIPYFSNFVNSDMDKDDARSMCLFPEEGILIKQDNDILKLTIGDLFVDQKGEQLDDEWFEMKSKVEALSLNPESGKLEWIGIQKMLKVTDRSLVSIRTRDGKTMKVSPDHLVAVYTKDGIITKKANEVNQDDFLLVMKDGSSVLQGNQEGVSKELAWFMGLFVADGNYLYDSRKQWKNKHRGIQISFNNQEKELIEKTKSVVKNLLNYDMKFILDSRYENSLRGYIYNSEFAKKMEEEYDVCKYKRLPKWIWSSSLEVINSFIGGFFDGDGYAEGKEIHINDQDLAEELNLLFQLVGISTSYVVRDNSQTIRIQHTLGRGAKGDKVIKDKMHSQIPEFLLDKKHVNSDDGSKLYQSYGCKTVGLSSIDRWGISNESIEWLRNSDFAVVGISEITISDLDHDQEFFDIELEKNHYFVHSQGNITHNCCRLRLDNRELRKRGGGLFGANPLTGSLGVVTINLARLGHISKSETEFKERLKELMDTARESLTIKRKIITKLTEDGLYPYSKFYLSGIKEMTGDYWSNHFNTIGLNGMNEACLNMFGSDIASARGHKFALDIMDFMREVITAYQEETGDLYNLEATPGEGCTYRFAKKDQETYSDIICANKEAVDNGADPYYTNSTHLPVGFTDDIFAALDLQDELQTKYTGGTVLHGFLGERISDIETTKKLVKKIVENYRLPYFTISPTFSVCPTHGYLAGEHKYCPRCDDEIKNENNN